MFNFDTTSGDLLEIEQELVGTAGVGYAAEPEVQAIVDDAVDFANGVGNHTGDDFWWHGLRICPDIDTIMYTLSGVVNKANGWGVANDDIRHMLGMMQQYGAEGWFGVGDKDLATDLLRTEALRNGKSLASIMTRLSKALGVLHYILPMCDAPIATMVDTVEHGEMAFQEYFVRERWQPTIRGLRLDGIERATIEQGR